MTGRRSQRVCPAAACASPPSARPACLVMSGCDAGFRLGGEECLDDRGEVFGVGGQVKVAAVIDVQLAARYQPVHDPGVDQRDDGVVVAGQDQGGLGQPRQPRQAGPADAGGELVVVASGRAGACRGVQQDAGQRRVVAHAAAVKLPGDAGRVCGVVVAPRGEHAQQDAGMSGDHQRAGAGGHQYQAAHPVRAAQGELLREPAAPGDAQHVGLLIAELVEQPAEQWRQRGQVVRKRRRRGSADAGHVEPDDGPPPVQRVDERLEHLQGGADAVAQQQRRPVRVPVPHCDSQDAPADAQGPYLLARDGAVRPAWYQLAQAAAGPEPGPRFPPVRHGPPPSSRTTEHSSAGNCGFRRCCVAALPAGVALWLPTRRPWRLRPSALPCQAAAGTLP